jgi:predicted protein tyrosine phosphatase
MKVLTICQGGQVRSVGLKYILTYKYNHEALACGVQSNTPDTISMLCGWADAIVILQKEFIQFVPAEHRNGKLFCYDVGPDRFGYAFHPELQSMLDNMIQKHGKFT